ncbi:MAG: rRNA maturation RNase YbeY, partial [Pseudomonadota bacterium]
QKCLHALKMHQPAGYREGITSFLFTDDQTIQQLNAEWRGKDKATNVLSFPTGDFPSLPGQPILLGDIVFAYGVCAGEAAEKHISVADHLCHLIVHGLLHLMGYDHVHEEQAEKMEALEIDLLSYLSIENPYNMDKCP